MILGFHHFCCQYEKVEEWDGHTWSTYIEGAAVKAKVHVHKQMMNESFIICLCIHTCTLAFTAVPSMYVGDQCDYFIAMYPPSMLCIDLED